MSVVELPLVAAGLPVARLSPLSRVYFAHDWCNIKIGKSITPMRRVGGQLRISMMFTVPGGLPEERRYHAMWDKYRIGRSEWFTAGDDLLLWLALNAPDEHGRVAVRTFVYSLKQKRAA